MKSLSLTNVPLTGRIGSPNPFVFVILHLNEWQWDDVDVLFWKMWKRNKKNTHPPRLGKRDLYFDFENGDQWLMSNEINPNRRRRRKKIKIKTFPWRNFDSDILKKEGNGFWTRRGREWHRRKEKKGNADTHRGCLRDFSYVIVRGKTEANGIFFGKVVKMFEFEWSNVKVMFKRSQCEDSNVEAILAGS